jgi:hypothetical protein
MEKLLAREAKQIDLVGYLEFLGYQPEKIKGDDYWYLSPLRPEKTASFKVNRRFNVWYDFGLSKGGNLVDFGILYFRCSVRELLEKLSMPNRFSFQPPVPNSKMQQPCDSAERGKIVIKEIRGNIQSKSLQQYLSIRKIPLLIADEFCHEIDFVLYKKMITTIGFKNSAGGYELRSANFKGSSSPKDVTIIGNPSSTNILVFEGFFDFLSYQAVHKQRLLLLPEQQPNFLILNSIGFLEKVRPALEKYDTVHLYLDRDSRGMSVTNKLLSLSVKYIDRSQLYKDYKDLNEYLVNDPQQIKRSQWIGKRL